MAVTIAQLGIHSPIHYFLHISILKHSHGFPPSAVQLAQVPMRRLPSLESSAPGRPNHSCLLDEITALLGVLRSLHLALPSDRNAAIVARCSFIQRVAALLLLFPFQEPLHQRLFLCILWGKCRTCRNAVLRRSKMSRVVGWRRETRIVVHRGFTRCMLRRLRVRFVCLCHAWLQYCAQCVPTQRTANHNCTQQTHKSHFGHTQEMYNDIVGNRNRIIMIASQIHAWHMTIYPW